MHRDPAQRGHHVADPWQRARAQRRRQRLQRLVGFQVKLIAELGVDRRIAKWRKAQDLE
jgi:hypothetical protein